MLGFENRKTSVLDNITNNLGGIAMGADLDDEQSKRLMKYRRYWNFYEGYHWEDMPDNDSAQVTVNFCATFVNKYVAFELGEGFTFAVHQDYEQEVVTSDGRTLFEYLEDIWEDNHQLALCTEIGQMKSVTGDAWLQVRYFPSDELVEEDPFGEYPNGRVAILLQPTSIIFPEYDPHRRDVLTKLTIMYQYEEVEKVGMLKNREKKSTKLFKQIWTKDTVETYLGTHEPITTSNKYGFIPFVQIKNFPLAGRNYGVSDLTDIIPMNVEYNIKKSNVSEILDYHAAPVTLVFGAKIGNLEKGANKLWGGLPKDAKVQNLELNGDLGASNAYTDKLKTEMCEVSGVPETVLGGSQSISNTSGVALQYMNLPLIERTKVKRQHSEDGFERLNKMIIVISLLEGLITKREDIPLRDFLHTEVELPDTLPKDELLLLQQLQIELQAGLESRYGALKRLGRENIETKIEEIDKERNEHPELFGGEAPQLNSGMGNGESPSEVMNVAKNGANVKNPENNS